MKKELSVDMLLNELNNDSLTNGEKAEILATVIDLESEKPDGDMDLIRECLDYLAFLNGEESAAEAEQQAERLQRIYQKAADGEGAAKGKKSSAGRKRRLCKVGVVAAIIVGILLVAMTSLTVIARVNGYDDVFEWITAHWQELPSNGHIMSGDTEFIWYKDYKSYYDIESWLEEEELDLLYPSVLPDGVQLAYIDRYITDEGIDFAYVFDPPQIFVNVQNYDLDHFEIKDKMEIIEVNGYRMGILNIPNDPSYKYYAYFPYGDFAYNIGAPDRDTLLFLLENLKKTNP